MNEFTPKPWVQEETVILRPNGRKWGDIIAQAYDPDDPQHRTDVRIANARLIAAAPELLAALERLTCIGMTADGGVIIGPQGWEAVAIVIAKARGEQP